MLRSLTLVRGLALVAVLAACIGLTVAAGPMTQPAETLPPVELMVKGQEGEPASEWCVPTDGWEARWVRDGKGLVVRLRQVGESEAPFGNTMSIVDAEPFRGKAVRLTARIRVEGGDGRAQMWLRVDRPDDQMGAFDNMHDRPVLAADPSGAWTDASIELDVAPDAQQLALGVMSIGGASVLIDSVRLTIGEAFAHQEATAPKTLSARESENLCAAARLLAYVRFFHPSDQAVAVKAWDQFAVSVMEAAEPATDAADLAARLQSAFAPVAPSLIVYAGSAEAAPGIAGSPWGATHLVHWRHNGAGTISPQRPLGNVYSSAVVREELSKLGDAGVAGWAMAKDLGGGVSCVLPVGVPADGAGTLPHADVATPWSVVEGQPRLTALNRSTRLAGVATCWGVMQHFYPYFDVVGTDWNAMLPVALGEASEDATEMAYLSTLRRLVGALHDGHGHVSLQTRTIRSILPLMLVWAGDELVVSGADPDAAPGVAVGDVVLAIDGRQIDEVCDSLALEISAATDGWRRATLQRAIAYELATPERVAMRLRRVDGTEYEATIVRTEPIAIKDTAAKRPANGAQVAPGICYFDLNGAESAALDAAMPVLERAQGIVFDMRGYPGSAGYELMQHLITGPATSAQWNVPIVTRPDREGWEWNGGGRWQLKPTRPRLTAPIAFITDGRAISYAESIMGIVEAYTLGEIVGATTAGTNGNVNPFELPGGFSVSWTGMKVLKHDGSRHHGVGIAATVPVEPTAAGIAAGRDEVLEKAVEVLKARINATDAPAPGGK